MLHRMHSALRKQEPPLAGNVLFHYNTRFSCTLFLQAWTSRCQPRHTWPPSKNPDFYDTCDAGVLIGKLPCTSTLAQSVANIPSHRKGRPSVMYHMNCLHMCHAVVNNAAQIYHCILFTRVYRELPWPQSQVQTQYFQPDTICPPSLPRRKTALPDVRH